MDRLRQWERFTFQMYKHIKQYAEKQYKSNDEKKDLVNAYDSKECVKAIEKYVARFGSGARGPKEQMRDMLKIAHYAQFAYDRLKTETGEGDCYQ